MVNKLCVGIVLYESFKREVGGGYSYYNTLISSIDNYEFNPLLEFVFVQFKGLQLNKFKKRCINFIPDETNGTIRNLKIGMRIARYIPIPYIRDEFHSRYKKKLTALRKKNIEDWLIDQKVDLLYYLLPEGGEYNYPFVTTHWDIGHYSTNRFPEMSMNNTFEFRENMYDKVFKKAFAIICESEAGKNELIRYKNIGPQNIFVVPLFPSSIVDLQIEYDRQQSILMNEFGLKRNDYFLYPAQFWSHKNHYSLLQAFWLVKKKHPTLKLILPGSDKGNLNYIKETVERLDLKNSVLFPGFITNESLYSLYKNAIALVMPTLLGPTNMPLLEAAILGCPVITSDFPGHRELLKDYAAYVNPLDVTELSEAMLNVIKSENEQNSAFDNSSNSISASLEKIEKHFLSIRLARKLWGFNFKQF